MPVNEYSSFGSRIDLAGSSQSPGTVLQEGPKQKRRACKPGSVPGGACRRPCVHHLSGPAVTGRLVQPTRRLELDSWTGRPPAARLCSWRGLPCRRRRRRRGGLLPHLFTLTGRRTAQPRATGSMFSVALSVRVARRRRGPGVTRRHALMEPGLSSTGAARRGRPAAVHRPASGFQSVDASGRLSSIAASSPSSASSLSAGSSSNIRSSSSNSALEASNASPSNSSSPP